MDSDLLSGIVAALADVALVVDDSATLHSVSVRDDSSPLNIFSGSIGRSVENVLTKDSIPKLHRRLRDLRARGQGGDFSGHVWCELTHLIAHGETAPVRYSIHMLPDSKQFLMLGTDQRPVIELQQQLVSAQIAMERDYESRREVDTRFRMAMETTRDAILFISVATRRIIEINGVGADLLGAGRSELTGVDIGHEFEGITSADLMERSLATSTTERPQPVEVLTRRTQKRLALHPRLFRAAGERLLIVRLEKAGSAPTASADPLDENLRQLYAKGVDGMVFTDREGIILSASESFLNLTDSPTLASVKGRSLADFLVRGAIDLTVMLENALRVGHLRVYPTRLRTDFNGQLQVEISATWISDGPQPVLALIVRDSGRIDAQRPGVGPTDAGIANVMELVGSTPLKDIVSETTDIVEKMCIENAIELTRNNRVAAAEMLGLSRQSLYVKLRKFGLISREND
ncbi:MAG: transcriptional regulator PpsR [Pararhodobacter sp.]